MEAKELQLKALRLAGRWLGWGRAEVPALATVWAHLQSGSTPIESASMLAVAASVLPVAASVLVSVSVLVLVSGRSFHSQNLSAGNRNQPTSSQSRGP